MRLPTERSFHTQDFLRIRTVLSEAISYDRFYCDGTHLLHAGHSPFVLSWLFPPLQSFVFVSMIVIPSIAIAVVCFCVYDGHDQSIFPLLQSFVFVSMMVSLYSLYCSRLFLCL